MVEENSTPVDAVPVEPALAIPASDGAQSPADGPPAEASGQAAKSADSPTAQAQEIPAEAAEAEPAEPLDSAEDKPVQAIPTDIDAPESTASAAVGTPEPPPPSAMPAQAEIPVTPAQQSASASAIAPAAIPASPQSGNIVRDLLLKARAKIQDRKRKKLDKIMDIVTAKGKVSNSEVEKSLKVSDATATRYLKILEREGRLRRVGKTSRSLFYVKPQ